MRKAAEVCKMIGRRKDQEATASGTHGTNMRHEEGDTCVTENTFHSCDCAGFQCNVSEYPRPNIKSVVSHCQLISE